MASEQQGSSFSQFARENRAVVILAVLAAIALIAAVIFGLLLIFRGDGLGSSGEATATPFANASNPNLPPIQVNSLSESGTVSVTISSPTTLRLAGRNFGVQPQQLSSGVWDVPTDENTAVWVYGSVVNFVLGLPNSENNRQLLEQINPGDEILLTTQEGREYLFTFNARDEINPNDPTLFSQNRPGVTLVLLGGDTATRLVVRGQYVIGETGGSDVGNVVELGEPAQLSDMQVTVLNSTYLANRTEAPPGFAFYLVTYEVRNTGLSAIDGGSLRFMLTDELGNQYAVSPIASQLGNTPPLGGFINSGQAVQATVGYQIPAGLVSPSLAWIVTRADTGDQLQVTLPFNGGGNFAQAATVALQTAEISQDLSSLILTGNISNSGQQPLVISEQDISLRTPDGSSYPMLSVNPAFPWTVGPDQPLSFIVTFQRPLVGNSANFTVLSQPYELTGFQP